MRNSGKKKESDLTRKRHLGPHRNAKKLNFYTCDFLNIFHESLKNHEELR